MEVDSRLVAAITQAATVKIEVIRDNVVVESPIGIAPLVNRAGVSEGDLDAAEEVEWVLVAAIGGGERREIVFHQGGIGPERHILRAQLRASATQGLVYRRGWLANRRPNAGTKIGKTPKCGGGGRRLHYHR